MDIKTAVRDAVALAQSGGAYQSEAYAINGSALEIEVSEEKLELMKLAKDTGIGIRIVTKNGSIGFAYTSDISVEGLKKTVDEAQKNGRQTAKDSNNTIARRLDNVPQMQIYDENTAKISVDEKINMAKLVEKICKQTDDRIFKCERSAYQDGEFEIAIANSNGTEASYKANYCGIFSFALAKEDDDVQTGMSMQFARSFAELDPNRIGREAAIDALRLVKAKSIDTTRASVVLSPYIATGFFSILIPALSADAVQKGRSLFKNKLKSQVVSPLITMIDDGTFKEGIAAAPFDGEGVLTRHKEVISNGVLNTYLYNTYTANKDNVESTGNAVRSFYKTVPSVGATNFYIKPGKLSNDEIISSVNKGFYVTHVMGMHTANPITGDFSLGASGVWIENGKLTYGVRGVAIAGNILELLSNVENVGNDLRFFGSKGAPTIAISSMTISGS